ncbi:MAG: hypothetical protein ACXV3S_04535, partial [Kineosporiaceae bacterium]
MSVQPQMDEFGEFGAELDELDDELDDEFGGHALVAPRPAARPELVRRVRVARQGVYDSRRQLAGYRVVFGVPDPEAGRHPG